MPGRASAFSGAQFPSLLDGIGVLEVSAVDVEGEEGMTKGRAPEGEAWLLDGTVVNSTPQKRR